MPAGRRAWSGQQVLLQLAEGVARQGVEEADLVRDLEGGELTLAVREQGGRLEGGLGDQVGDRDLAPFGVRAADDGGLADPGEGEERLLDLARVDVEAAGDDQLVAAAEPREWARPRILPGEVAGAEPAAAGGVLDEARGGLLRRLPIAAEDVGAAHQHA